LKQQEVRRRQKVKPYFLPVQSAKKNRRSLPFFEKKATQHQGKADASLFFHGLKARLPAFKPQTYRSGYSLTLT
jgi:hypothetical protein